MKEAKCADHWVMWTGYGWCGWSTHDVTPAIGLGLDQCDSPRPVSPSRCLFSLSDVHWSRCVGHNQCFLDNTLRPYRKWSSWCSHDTSYSCRTWIICMSLTDVAFQMHISHFRACGPLLMLHTIGHHRCQDAHIPHPCVPSLAKVAGHWQTSFSICTHDLKNAWIPWLMLPVIGW